MAFRARKVSGTFEKRASALDLTCGHLSEARLFHTVVNIDITNFSLTRAHSNTSFFIVLQVLKPAISTLMSYIFYVSFISMAVPDLTTLNFLFEETCL